MLEDLNCPISMDKYYESMLGSAKDVVDVFIAINKTQTNLGGKSRILGGFKKWISGLEWRMGATLLDQA